MNGQIFNNSGLISLNELHFEMLNESFEEGVKRKFVSKICGRRALLAVLLTAVSVHLFELTSGFAS